MAPRAMSTASISFGLVTVPVRVYAATEVSAGLSFNLLHAKDGVRLQQQLVCPSDGEVVPRKDAVKGYEFSKGRYVTFTNEELKALEEKATQGIEIDQFVPLSSVDPVFFERTYYLAADKGGERAFALLAQALAEKGLAAVGQYAARGKDYLVAVRSSQGRLVMHQLLHRDEVRSIEEIPSPEREAKPAELTLARELIERLERAAFEPRDHEDRVRKRVKELIDRKVAGENVVEARVAAPRGQVIDLMEALKASLERKRGETRQPDAEPAPAKSPSVRGSRAPRAARGSRKAG